MRKDTPATPGNSPARQIATYFGAIADTLDWHYTDWQALNARLQSSGTPIGKLTLDQVHTLITDQQRGVRKAGG